jgi:hypothetical protein
MEQLKQKCNDFGQGQLVSSPAHIKGLVGDGR